MMSIQEKLTLIGQQHLLEKIKIDALSSSQRKLLQQDIDSIEVDLFKRQQELIFQLEQSKQEIAPFTNFAVAGSDPTLLEKGKQLIAEGKMGCLLLAGGQGTRLGFEGPKGCYPISIIRHKSLFQLCAEKVLALGKQVGRLLLLAIMVSPQNKNEIEAFFEHNHFFGLLPDQVFFFSQTELPLLDIQGDLFLETLSHIALGPDGNGRCLEHFVRSGIWQNWYESGVRYLNLVLIDNPLADPFDAELLGFHCLQEVDVTVKCTEKLKADEKVGLLVKSGDGCRIIEYSEMSDEEKCARDLQGKLKYRCANLSLFCFSMEFVKTVSSKTEDLPLHKAWKSVSYLDKTGKTCKSTQPNAWKFEFFIFDILKYTNRVATLIYPREFCFAPLKNATGSDSPEKVKKALQQFDLHVIEKITGLRCPEFAFELAPEFYYPTEELITKWRGVKLLRSGYIETVPS